MPEKPEQFYKQSAAIPFIGENGELKVVLITTTKGKHWIIPKGVVEKDMSPADSAAKEALEEAGVLGNISNQAVASYNYEKWGGTCHVQVFPLEVTELLDQWEEMQIRDRCVVAISSAVELVKPELEEILKDFEKTAQKSQS